MSKTPSLPNPTPFLTDQPFTCHSAGQHRENSIPVVISSVVTYNLIVIIFTLYREKCFILNPVHKRPAGVLASITVYLNDRRSLMRILVMLFLFDSIHSKCTKVVPGTTAAFKQFILPTTWMNFALGQCEITLMHNMSNLITVSYATHLSSYPDRCCDLSRNTIRSTL